MGPNALGKLARRRIDTKLTGEKQRVAQLDARRVRTDGGRSIRGSNSLFVHTGSIQERVSVWRPRIVALVYG